ncbi:hypothetical protein SAMN04489740_3829 [Arthrobacter alpinus]|uniref:Uncharacterized protein n=1 Tax=Arthrobacter alpinus TaxID=656366 RepID=A0A1H5NLQ0_9MICC|nr:hypothetical protein [Arthrobacter alpinus]SEF02526.1 hypothetical protein SAMN04489740_3829 [Arthrobacter alpinus]
MATPPHIPGLGAFLDKDSSTPRPAAPRPVTVAVWLLVLAAAAQIVASVMGIIHAVSPERAQVLQAQLAADPASTLSLEAMRNMGVITVVLAALATVSAYVLFAFFLHKGRMWARTATSVLVVLTLSQLVGIVFPGGFTTIAQLVLGSLAIALCYMPASKTFFADMKAYRG